MKYQKELNLSVGLCRHSLATNGSADLRSPEKEVYFRSWDFAHHQNIRKFCVSANFLINFAYMLYIQCFLYIFGFVFRIEIYRIYCTLFF